MAGWVIRAFRGIAPRSEPRLLQDNQAQSAVNCKLWHGSLRPLSENLEVPGAITKTGTIQTIHRFGHDVASDSAYWFHWQSDVDVCRGQIFGDVSERTYYTDGVLPKVTDTSIALSGGDEYPTNSYTLGVPAPTACTAVVSGTGTGLEETRAYTYTFVTGWGEEGRPAPSSTLVNVKPGQTVSLSGLAVAPAGNYQIASKRIYRTSSDGSSATFLFVAEIPVATVSYTDTKATENLGETLPSNTYSMPPAGLKGLTSMPNGMMVGFVGKDIYFCEPYKPYAWPIGYSMTTDYEIVALGSIDTTLVVMTKGFPYLVQGSAPELMTMIKAEIPQACVSKRSARFLGGSIVYASPDGLFSLSSAGTPLNLTENIFTGKEWSEWFNPSSINGYVVDDKYVGFYVAGERSGGFIVDPKKGDFTLLGFHATAGYYDPQRDALFLVVDGKLVKFDSGTANLTANWKTKTFYVPRPVSMGAIRVEAKSYPVQVEVYADGVLKETVSILSESAQRLGAGYTAKTWEAEITTGVEVYSFALAQFMRDVANG